MLYQNKHCKNESFWNHFLMSSTPAFSMSYIPKRTSHGSGGGMGRVFRQLMTFQSLPIKKIGIFPPKNCYDKNESKAPKMKKKRNKGKKKIAPAKQHHYTPTVWQQMHQHLWKAPKVLHFARCADPSLIQQHWNIRTLVWCFYDVSWCLMAFSLVPACFRLLNDYPSLFPLCTESVLGETCQVTVA